MGKQASSIILCFQCSLVIYLGDMEPDTHKHRAVWFLCILNINSCSLAMTVRHYVVVPGIMQTGLILKDVMTIPVCASN